MRVECPECKELHPGKIASVSVSAVRFECAGCRATFAHPREGGARVAGSTVEAQQQCPKCKEPFSGQSSACASCGLSAERFANFESPGELGSELLQEDWARVEESWDEASLHEAFLERAALAADYRGAASRYRRAAENEARKERAEEMLERIQSMAAAALLSVKPKVVAEEEPFRKVLVLLMVLVLIAGAGGVYVTMKGRQQQQDSKSLHPYSGTGTGSGSSRPLRRNR